TSIGLAMNRRYGSPQRLGAPQWAGMRRIARALSMAMAPFAGELRRLNRIGAGAGSRVERVRIVKQTLAHRGKGPNRCC
ncbi:MAG: hypothetical protein ACRETL_15770, partial [Gammaproteobacteria bacterium]